MTHEKFGTVHKLCHAGCYVRFVNHFSSTGSEVKCLAGFLDMERAQIAVDIAPVEVPHAVGDIAGLLYLDQEITSTDAVNLTSTQVEHVPRT